MWRATIRLSFDGDKKSVTRNECGKILKAAGFRNVKTGTWEALNANATSLNNALMNVMAKAEQSGKVDHFWVHVESLSLRQKTDLAKAYRALVS